MAMAPGTAESLGCTVTRTSEAGGATTGTTETAELRGTVDRDLYTGRKPRAEVATATKAMETPEVTDRGTASRGAMGNNTTNMSPQETIAVLQAQLDQETRFKRHALELLDELRGLINSDHNGAPIKAPRNCPHSCRG